MLLVHVLQCVLQLLKVLVLLAALLLHLALLWAHRNRLADLWVHLGIAHLVAIVVLVLHVHVVYRHFQLGRRVLLGTLQVSDLLAKLGDQHDELDVLCHDLHVLLLVDVLRFLEATFQTVLRVLQVSSLILELLLDIWINFDVLGGLVFDVGVQIFVNDLLQLIGVINVLNDPVDSVFELTNLNVVLADLGTIVPDHIDHVLLARFQVIDYVTQVGVDLVVMFQVLVHLVCLTL